jgi:hypothetical protein
MAEATAIPMSMASGIMAWVDAFRGSSRNIAASHTGSRRPPRATEMTRPTMPTGQDWQEGLF